MKEKKLNYEKYSEDAIKIGDSKKESMADGAIEEMIIKVGSFGLILGDDGLFKFYEFVGDAFSAHGNNIETDEIIFFN